MTRAGISLRHAARVLVAAVALAVSTGAPAAAGVVDKPAVDVNTAAAGALERVNGIGAVLAARIVEERRHGPFRDADDLKARVRGIGAANLRRIIDGGLVVAASGRAPGVESIVGRGPPGAAGVETIVGGTAGAPAGQRKAQGKK